MIRFFNCVWTASLMLAALRFLNLWFIGLESIYSYAVLVVWGTGQYWAGAELRELDSVR